jgi:hypothetical protein
VVSLLFTVSYLGMGVPTVGAGLLDAALAARSAAPGSG